MCLDASDCSVSVIADDTVLCVALKLLTDTDSSGVVMYLVTDKNTLAVFVLQMFHCRTVEKKKAHNNKHEYNAFLHSPSIQYI